MKIEQSVETYGAEDRKFVEIRINGEKAFSVHDGEPEDNTISRNFNDIWNILSMLKEAHEAGLRGEYLYIIDREVDEEEEDDE